MMLSCSNGTEDNTNKLIINVDNIKPLPLSEIASAVDYVFLESLPDVFLGEVSKVEFFQNEFFVFDRSYTNQIFVFDSEGSFKRKIGAIGDGPEEYGEANDFLLLKDESQVVVLDTEAGYVSLVYYTADGEFIKKVRSELFADLFEFIAPNVFVFYTSNQCNDEFCAPFFTTNLDLEIIDNGTPLVDFYEEFWMEPSRPMSLYNGSVLLTNYGTRLIHKVGSSGKFGIANEVDFLGNNAEETIEEEKYGSIESLINDYSEKRLAFHLEEMVALENGFFFSFQYGTKYINAFVDQKNAETYLFESLDNDFDQVPLKFLVKGKFENTLLTTLNPEEYNNYFSQLEDRGLEMPEKLAEIKKRLRADSNPVLVKIEMSKE